MPGTSLTLTSLTQPALETLMERAHTEILPPSHLEQCLAAINLGWIVADACDANKQIDVAHRLYVGLGPTMPLGRMTPHL